MKVKLFVVFLHLFIFNKLKKEKRNQEVTFKHMYESYDDTANIESE